MVHNRGVLGLLIMWHPPVSRASRKLTSCFPSDGSSKLSSPLRGSTLKRFSHKLFSLSFFFFWMNGDCKEIWQVESAGEQRGIQRSRPTCRVVFIIVECIHSDVFVPTSDDESLPLRPCRDLLCEGNLLSDADLRTRARVQGRLLCLHLDAGITSDLESKEIQMGHCLGPNTDHWPVVSAVLSHVDFIPQRHQWHITSRICCRLKKNTLTLRSPSRLIDSKWTQSAGPHVRPLDILPPHWEIKSTFYVFAHCPAAETTGHSHILKSNYSVAKCPFWQLLQDLNLRVFGLRNTNPNPK